MSVQVSQTELKGALSSSIFIRLCVADEPEQHLVTRPGLFDVHDLVSVLKEYRSRCVLNASGNTQLCITVVFGCGRL